MSDDRERDPTKISSQAPLTTSNGTIWLIVGGLMALISIVLLWSLQQVNSSGVAILAIVVIVLLYVAMVEIRLLVRVLRVRLILMAVCFSAIAAVALAFVIVIGVSAVAP